MKQKKNTQTMVLAAMFLAIAFVLPFLTGQIPQIGAMLCPMHIPVILCGFICGAPWGFLVGVIAPLLRSVVLGMPPMFPTAICMASELAVYGLMSGVLYKLLNRKKINIYLSLIFSMICGRIVWGIAMFLCMGITGGEFGFAAFIAGAVTNAILGIILQIVLIPILVMTLERIKDKN
ncbi:MAG: ECF transporter S component [Lachnospiraceae bacterium]|nr:ECF transporter S component [Lachnospiraceae bacterium]